MRLLVRIFLLFSLLLASCQGSALQPTTEPAASLTPAPATSPTPLPTDEPLPIHLENQGVYLGTFHGTAQSSVQLFQSTGKGVAISAVYLNWNDGFNPGFARANAGVGRLSLLTWEYLIPAKAEYPDRLLEAITDGQYDSYIETWAAGAAKYDQPIMLRWGHEMNGDWYPWGGAKNGAGATAGFGDPEAPDGPERFVAAYKYIHEKFQEAGADKVLWVWCPNAPFEAMDKAYGGSGWNRAENYYPGDEYVDWLCFDGYNWGTSAAGQAHNSTWTEFDDIFRESYQRLQAINPNKPIIIGEFASTEDGGDKASWIRNTFQVIERNYPQIRAIIWFHINKETDWRINSSPQALEAYRQAVAGEYWLERWIFEP